MENKIHLWQGEWIDSSELELRVKKLPKLAAKTYNLDFPLSQFIDVCDQLGKQLAAKDKVYKDLLAIALENAKMNQEEIESMFGVIAEFMNKEALVKKLKNELATDDPFEIKRLNFKEHQFEGYAPLGLLVHVAPSNVFTVSILCIVEGLLTGNLNFLKTSGSESLLPQHFFKKLIDLDETGRLKEFIIIAKISSKSADLLKQILSYADGISAWGSEEAIKSLSQMAPDGAKVIKWGHKISFGYISKEYLNDEAELTEMAKDVCRIEQQACSSPQNIYAEVSSFEELVSFAERFASILYKVSAEIPITEPESNFQAEITNIVEVAKAEESLKLTKVFEAEDKSVRILVDSRKALRASPLFRTVWLKPLLKDEIIETLYPMRSYLQTVGLSCPLNRLGEFSRLFFKAGVLRINNAGSMLAGYIGEPHDGKFALSEFMRRISVNLSNRLESYSSMNEFNIVQNSSVKNFPVFTKEDFQNMEVPEKYIELIVKSGGSSGKTVYSNFTWDDYHTQMLNAAYGLYAAGLDPAKDSIIDLLAAGNLYGGFISFWTILEMMQIRQYPMAITDDLEYTAKIITENNINSIISVPSYIIKLFSANEELFKKHKCVKKIFYAGEHLTKGQRSYLQDTFGVEVIRSAAYGSNDAGPIGFQCSYCKGTEHHLLTNLQEIEILKIDSDEPADTNEPGRIILTSKKRKGQAINRYEIGDLGRMTGKECACGRKQPVFELLGRTGDVFKAGGPFLNYNAFIKTLDSVFNYNGNAQILLENIETNNTLTLKIEDSSDLDISTLSKVIVENDDALNFSIRDLNLKFVVEKVPMEKFEFVKHSGKLKKIIDKRI